MKINKILCNILIVCVLFSALVPSASALEPPQAEAAVILVADLDSGNILYEKNMNVSRAPASLTKIMTCLMAVEAVERGKVNLSDMVTAQQDCREGLDETSSSSGIMPGETMSFENLLYCAMVESANEACNVIASHLEGSVSAFVEKMNDRAQKLGATNTHFNDPNGLSNSDHYSTAYDLYLIAKEAISHPLFMQLCDTDYYQVPATNMSAPRDLYNSNALISAGSIYGDGYLYEGAKGVKTGYTSLAGYCLISTAERNDVHLMTIVLGCGGMLNTGESEYGNFVSSRNIYDWAFENFSYRTVVSSGQALKQLEVQYAEEGTGAVLRPIEDVRMLLPNDSPDPEIVVHPAEGKLVAPIDAGTQLGTADIVVDGNIYSVIKLYTTTDISMAKGDFVRAKLKEIFSAVWLRVLIVVLAVLGVGYVVLMIRYRKMREQHLRERAEAAKKRKMMEERRRREYIKNQREARQREIIIEQQRDKNVPRARDPETNEVDLDQLIKSLGLDKKQ